MRNENSVKKVSYTRMDEGTVEDYALTGEHNKRYAAATSGRVLAQLELLRDREEIVVAALLHDIGDILAPLNHAAIAAEILKPFVSRQVHWMLEKHAVFQGYYFWDKVGLDKNARDKYRGHPAFEMTERFCGEYDQTSSDPNYDTLALETFLPMVERVFGREPWGPHSRSEWPLED